MSTTSRTLVLGLVLGALLAPAAHASSTQSSIMMDDDQLVYRGDANAYSALSRMKALGVDTVRVTVLWKVVAANARFTAGEIKKLKSPQAKAAARLQTKRFRAIDPGTYPQQNWDRYDNLVGAARQIGIRVYFNVTGPGPSWTQPKPPRSLGRAAASYKPNPKLFKQYVVAVGKRYSGAYVDDNGCRCVLPRVSFWSLWNEPNQAGWLSPQWDKVHGKLVAVSPQLFRRLYQFGFRGLLASGHRLATDTILLGETAPLGSPSRSATSPMAPGVFLRELACVQPNGRSYGASAAKLRSCADFRRYGALKANGFAHHPYTKNIAPNRRSKITGAITMANISSLGGLLDKLSSRTGHAIPARLALYMTEFGFETNPPDPFKGVSWARQASYDTLGEYMAYKNPRIASQTQFLLTDVPPVAGRPVGSRSYWFTYQSGLFTASGSPKLAAYGYVLPFLATRRGVVAGTGRRNYRLWGQLRFLPPPVTNGTAVVQYRPRGAPASAWTTFGPAIGVNARGFFKTQRTAPVAGAIEWRGAWLKPDGTIGLTSLPSSG